MRFWTLIGGTAGLIGGFALAIYAAQVNGLIVGGKHPVSLIPYCIVGFEGTILLGTIANFAGMLFYSRLGKTKLPSWYDRKFSVDRYGLFVAATPEWFPAVREVFTGSNCEEIHEISGKR